MKRLFLHKSRESRTVYIPIPLPTYTKKFSCHVSDEKYQKKVFCWLRAIQKKSKAKYNKCLLGNQVMLYVDCFHVLLLLFIYITTIISCSTLSVNHFVVFCFSEPRF